MRLETILDVAYYRGITNIVLEGSRERITRGDKFMRARGETLVANNPYKMSFAISFSQTLICVIQMSFRIIKRDFINFDFEKVPPQS